MKLHLSTAIIGLAMTSALAHADWTGAGSAGFAMANGNSKSESGNAKLDIADQIDRWKHSVLVDALYGSSNSITSANRWSARWQSDYKLTEPLFAFGALRYEQDHFGAFSYQESAAVGLGYKLIDDDATKLTAQAGIGVKKSEPQTLVKDSSGKVIQRIDGDATTRGLVTAGLAFEHTLTATTKVVDKFLVESTSDNTFLQNDLALQVAMSEKLALSLGYGIRENTSPPSGAKRFDGLTTVSLVYSIK